MGGNVKVKYGLHEYQGQPILLGDDLTEIQTWMRYISWKVSAGCVLHPFYSGTTDLILNPSLSYADELLQLGVTQIGDIDVMLPIEAKGKIDFFNVFIGSIAGMLIGKKSIGNQDHLVVFCRLGFVQVDVRYVPFVDGKPTEFSVFSHSAPWLDIRKGFKGYVHKVALAILARMRGYAFSVDYGLRKADAKKPYEYITDIDQIHEALIGHLPDPIERELFGSFIGLIELMDRYIPNREDKLEFASGMQSRLWGKDALAIPEEMKIKVMSYIDNTLLDLDQ